MLTPRETDLLMLATRELGIDASDDASEETYTDAQIDQIGAETLGRVAASLRTKRVQQLFLLNFQRAWHFRETDLPGYEDRITALPG